MNPRRIVVSTPDFGLSGATAFVAKLITSLQFIGWEVKWLVTGHQRSGSSEWLGTTSWPIEWFPETSLNDVQSRQTFLVSSLNSWAPCIYLPTFDFDMIHAVPALSRDVKTVFIIHSDESVYYEHAMKFGHSLNAIVAVSTHIANHLSGRAAGLLGRIHTIFYGVDVPKHLPSRDCIRDQPLLALYCGRLAQRQKRIRDLAAIINRCHEMNLGVNFLIAGTGPDEDAFFEQIKAPLTAGRVLRLGMLPNSHVVKLLEQSDAMLMTSDFEGLPIILIEAMSRGCIPVVTRTESGTNDVVRDGQNGFLLPVGDIDGFVSILSKLAVMEPSSRANLRMKGFRQIQVGFDLEKTVEKYDAAFKSVMLSDDKIAIKRDGVAVTPCHYSFKYRLLKRLTRLSQHVRFQTEK